MARPSSDIGSIRRQTRKRCASRSSTRKAEVNDGGGSGRVGHGLRLQQRLLEAAEDLLAHQGRRVMSVTFPGAEPPLFIVIGETPQLVDLLAAATREVKGED